MINSKIKYRNSFLKFIIKNLCIVLPKNYFENFAVIEKIDKLNWPKKSKINLYFIWPLL